MGPLVDYEIHGTDKLLNNIMQDQKTFHSERVLIISW